MKKVYPGYKCYDGEVKKIKDDVLHLDIGGRILKFHLTAIAEVTPGEFIVVAYKDSDKKKIRDARLYRELSEEEKEHEYTVAGEFVSYEKGLMTIKPYGSKKRERYRVKTDKKIEPKMFVSLGYSSIDDSKVKEARIIDIKNELKPLTKEEIAKIDGLESLPIGKWERIK